MLTGNGLSSTELMIDNSGRVILGGVAAAALGQPTRASLVGSMSANIEVADEQISALLFSCRWQLQIALAMPTRAEPASSSLVHIGSDGQAKLLGSRRRIIAKTPAANQGMEDESIERVLSRGLGEANARVPIESQSLGRLWRYLDDHASPDGITFSENEGRGVFVFPCNLNRRSILKLARLLASSIGKARDGNANLSSLEYAPVLPSRVIDPVRYNNILSASESGAIDPSMIMTDKKIDRWRSAHGEAIEVARNAVSSFFKMHHVHNLSAAACNPLVVDSVMGKYRSPVSDFLVRVEGEIASLVAAEMKARTLRSALAT